MADRTSRRGIHDEAGVGPDPRGAVSLTPLKKLGDYRVADGEPDIRGWTAFTATGRELGEVEDLLVDTKTNEVVMLDIDLKRDDRHTLAPIKAAWIDRDHKRVVINSQYLVNDDDIPALQRTRRALRRDDAVVAPATAVAAADAGDSDVEALRRFNERYDRAYGERGWEGGRPYRISAGDDELRLERPLPLPAADEPDAVRHRGEREVRFPRWRGDARAAEPIVIEEHIVRRRIVDASELSPEELERLRRDAARDAGRDTIREGIESHPPAEERR